MVDLALMRALIDALAAHTTLILLGDPDQLVSVSAGSVLADWVNAAQADPAGLGAHSAHLTHVWRAEQGLAQVYAAVRSGDAARLQQLLATADDVRLQPIDDGAALTRQLQQWVARPEWANLHALAQSAEPEPALLALRQLQLLTALRGGRYGAEQVNAQIDEHWRHAWGDAQWYPGRPVLIRHNDYGRRLFNGDVGLALGLGAELRVYFETVDGDGRASVRALSPRELPEYDLAYALTVHQSQGSEYGHVAVLLPPDAQNRILSRQLLYTAVSRARRSVELWCSVSSLHVALSRLSLRAGGLRARLGAPNMHTGTL
jgi:exodeoxyribonuclease V alpha subunit